MIYFFLLTFFLFQKRKRSDSVEENDDERQIDRTTTCKIEIISHFNDHVYA
jgi:hypothetical protein